MDNKNAVDFYNDLRSICDQVSGELNIAFHYFEENHDYNGRYILYQERVALDGYFRSLDERIWDLNNLNNQFQLYVPNIYEWGFFNFNVLCDAEENVDSSILHAYSQRNNSLNEKLYLTNGCFYGYYCYNIYNKGIQWINYSLKKFSMTDTNLLNYFQERCAFFMRFEDATRT